MCFYINICMLINLCLYKYAYTCVHIHMLIYIHAYKHTDTHTHMIHKDRERWRAAVHGVVKSRTWLRGWTTTYDIKCKHMLLIFIHTQARVLLCMFFKLLLGHILTFLQLTLFAVCLYFERNLSVLMHKLYFNSYILRDCMHKLQGLYLIPSWVEV